MKTEIEIEIKKIRKKLKVHTLTPEDKTLLRDTLEHLKALFKVEKGCEKV